MDGAATWRKIIKAIEVMQASEPDGSTRILQMNGQFAAVLGLFCYKNHCNTIITPGQTRVTRRVIPTASHCGWISTAA